MKKMKQLVVCMLCAMFLCACGSASETISQDETKTENETMGNAETKNELDSTLGEWVCVAREAEQDLDVAEDIYLTSSLTVYQEDEKYKLDLEYFYEDYDLEIFGKSIERREGSLYQECANQEWYADVIKKEYDGYSISYKVALLDADTLELYRITEYTDADEESCDMHLYYKKADSDLEAAIYQYRYQDEIVVSNVKDFYNAIGNNRKIILKEGTYNLSELSEEDKDNKKVNWRYDYIYGDQYEDGYTYDYVYFPEEQIYCYEVKNLIIEGEEGADVHICTEDEMIAPLAFNSCNHITLRNLRIGHMVEPGVCAGAVTYFNYVQKVEIDNCSLYGCGTYGISAENSSEFDVTNTDIYECSYGLIDLRGCYSMNITDSTLRDSKDLSMFSLWESSSIHFKNCTITGNDSTKYEDTAFIDCTNTWGDITFENCKFSNNKYKTLQTGEAEFINCEMNDQ